jgi:hypothetical protein
VAIGQIVLSGSEWLDLSAARENAGIVMPVSRETQDRGSGDCVELDGAEGISHRFTCMIAANPTRNSQIAIVDMM